MTRGIRTLADLYARCRHDEATGCQHWLGCLDERGPRVRFWHDGKSILRIGRRAALILSGRTLGSQVAYARKCCHSPDCVAPAHAVSAPRSEWMATMIRRGVTGASPESIRALNRLAVKRRKLTDAQVAEIRAAVGVTYSELGRRFGVNHRRIHEIRTFRTYRPRAETLPAASVWTWRPAEVANDERRAA